MTPNSLSNIIVNIERNNSTSKATIVAPINTKNRTKISLIILLLCQ